MSTEIEELPRDWTFCYTSKQFYKSTSKQLRKNCGDFNVARAGVWGNSAYLL